VHAKCSGFGKAFQIVQFRELLFSHTAVLKDITMKVTCVFLISSIHTLTGNLRVTISVAFCIITSRL
jgi:hypothetical protein